MATFKVTWPEGETVSVNQSDCSTPEQFINCYFGSSYREDIKVEMEGESETAVKAPTPVTETPVEIDSNTDE